MLSTVLVLGGFAAAGVQAAQHNHRHRHLHDRDVQTVVDVVTEIVTEYVGPDGEPFPSSTTSTSTTSTSSTTTTTPSSQAKEAIFIQVSESTSTTPSAPSTTSISTPTVVIPPIPTIPESSTTAAPAPLPVGGAETINGWRVYTIINSHTAAVSTSHDDTVGTPTSNGAELAPGTMAPGATATFVAPPSWVGNIAFTDAKYSVGPSNSLIEANFVEWFGALRADFDISYVNGFSLPATCSCGGETTAGCNLDLLQNPCPGGLVDGSCANPLRASEAATAASSFFSACEGAAWTYVNDGQANAQCVSGSVVCCIGANCPANPKQGSL